MQTSKDKLITLQGSYKNGASGTGVLHVGTTDEYVSVYLKGNNISKVVYGDITIKKPKKTLIIGKGNEKRKVCHYLTKKEAPQLRMGITKHLSKGSWSSLPHPFELHPELGFEECFFYLLKGGDGIQIGRGVWSDGEKVDTMWRIRDKTFSTIPMGYHAVVGEPGVEVSYIWCYLAKKKHWEKI